MNSQRKKEGLGSLVSLALGAVVAVTNITYSLAYTILSGDMPLGSRKDGYGRARTTFERNLIRKHHPLYL